MSVLLFLPVFSLGMVIGFELIAAGHGFIDLGYTLKTAWPRLFFKILIWTGLAASIALLAGPVYRTALAAGLAAAVVNHLGVFALNRFVLGRKRDFTDV
ncbi:MAG: hypothetical protein AB1641_20150 [Thermodesulfobacteriota bacterium]